MAQHQRLGPDARNITASHLLALTKDEITQLFMEARWGNVDKQMCPHCGTLDKHYERRIQRRYARRPTSSTGTNPQWTCRHCFNIFSITSGTLFDQTRLPLRTIVLGIVLVLGAANGMSNLALSSHLGVTPKTAFLFQHRLREAMADDPPLEKFTSVAQMDGGYFCGKPVKPNRKMRVSKEQLKRRWGKKPVGETEKPWVAMGMTRTNYEKRANKRTVLVVTHSDNVTGAGSRQVAVAVSRGENETAIRHLANQHIEHGALVMTDEAVAYSVLDSNWEHATVSHSEEFCTAEGVNDNHCEAFFSRLRRAEYGIYHGFRPLYLHLYAWEAAWRHNQRRMPKRDQVVRLLSKCLTMRPSARFRGYHAGKGVRKETLI
ncbi:MAG: IS1595 family transposase [Arenimonas sp.]